MLAPAPTASLPDQPEPEVIVESPVQTPSTQMQAGIATADAANTAEATPETTTPLGAPRQVQPMPLQAKAIAGVLEYRARAAAPAPSKAPCDGQPSHMPLQAKAATGAVEYHAQAAAPAPQPPVMRPPSNPPPWRALPAEHHQPDAGASAPPDWTTLEEWTKWTGRPGLTAEAASSSSSAGARLAAERNAVAEQQLDQPSAGALTAVAAAPPVGAAGPAGPLPPFQGPRTPADYHLWLRITQELEARRETELAVATLLRRQQLARTRAETAATGTAQYRARAAEATATLHRWLAEGEEAAGALQEADSAVAEAEAIALTRSQPSRQEQLPTETRVAEAARPGRGEMRRTLATVISTLRACTTANGPQMETALAQSIAAAEALLARQAPAGTSSAGQYSPTESLDSLDHTKANAGAAPTPVHTPGYEAMPADACTTADAPTHAPGIAAGDLAALMALGAALAEAPASAGPSAGAKTLPAEGRLAAPSGAATAPRSPPQIIGSNCNRSGSRSRSPRLGPVFAAATATAAADRPSGLAQIATAATLEAAPAATATQIGTTPGADATPRERGASPA